MKYRIRFARNYDNFGWRAERKLRWWPWWLDCNAGGLFSTVDEAKDFVKILRELEQF